VSVNATRGRLGLAPLTTAVISSYVGHGVEVLVGRALGGRASEAGIGDDIAFFKEHYHCHMLDHTVTYPGVREALAALEDRTMAVLTNKPVRFSCEMLRGLGILHYFSSVYGDGSLPYKKPHPAGVDQLMRDTGRGARETMMIGDSETDVLTGRNAGVWTCGVTYGIGSKTLERTPPDFMLSDLRDLPSLLDGRRDAARKV
ncbi:MAG: HAD family hydrolase, partial [Terriglobia bacterium]